MQSPFQNLRGIDKTGLAVPGLLALLSVYIFSAPLLTLFGTLVTLAEDTTYLLLMALAVGLVLVNGRNIMYAYGSLALSITRFIVRVNPINTLDVAIERITRRQEEIMKARAESKASQTRMSLRIRNPSMRDGAEDHAEAEEQLAVTASQKGRPQTEIAVHATAALRWRQQADTFKPKLEQLKKMQLMLDQAQELADAKIADLKNQRDVLAVTLAADKDGAKAVGLFKRVLGRSSEMAMAQLSIDEIVRQSTEAEAEIDQFLDAITPQLQEQDLKKQAGTDAAMKRFAQFTENKTAKQLPEAMPAAVAAGIKQGEIVSDRRVN